MSLSPSSRARRNVLTLRTPCCRLSQPTRAGGSPHGYSETRCRFRRGRCSHNGGIGGWCSTRGCRRCGPRAGPVFPGSWNTAHDPGRRSRLRLLPAGPCECACVPQRVRGDAASPLAAGPLRHTRNSGATEGGPIVAGPPFVLVAVYPTRCCCIDPSRVNDGCSRG